jgi:hypothetical protein
MKHLPENNQSDWLKQSKPEYPLLYVAWYGNLCRYSQRGTLSVADRNGRSASKDTELEQLYANLLKETSPHEKAISRDLGRTFPHHSFFNDGQGVGQESLFNVLKAYSL